MRGFGEPSSQVESSVFGLTTTRPYPWGFGDPNRPNSTVNLETQPDLGFGDVMPDARFVILVGGARGRFRISGTKSVNRWWAAQLQTWTQGCSTSM